MAQSRPELVAVLPETLQLQRSYWAMVHADLVHSTPVKLALAFIRQEIKKAAPLFLGKDLLAAAPKNGSKIPR